MFLIGNVSEENRKLVEVVRESVYKGLDEVKPWGFLGDMGQAVHEHIKAHGYSVVREIGGHGVGLEFHEDPFVAHIGKRGTGMVLVPGMVITIEPMINAGKAGVVIDPYDDWTISTKDHSDSAQWEYTILITETGNEILTY
jgi:methionyl aminopeptidase